MAEVSPTLEGMLSALVNAGYYVSFTKDPEGYVASVSRAEPGDGDRYEFDSIGDTLHTALRAALPEGIEARDPDPGDRIPQLEGYVDILIRTLGRLTRPSADCDECCHEAAAHWEIAEPGSASEVHGPRTGCAMLGCECRAYAYRA